jgi:glycosyltransferase involved in cell wall biosynthesis
MIFCTTIIPTVGRVSLTHAVESVLEQRHPAFDFEIIVVNDSGHSLPPAVWQKSPRVKTIDINRRERSVARNTGAAAAKGEYLHFLDDDDWLAPGALQHFHEFSQNSRARWIYGITQLVDRQHQPLLRLHHKLNGNCFLQVMAGEWIPLQSSLIDRAIFLRVGGFNPLISGPEDIDLLRRVLLEADIAEMPELAAYVVRGEEGSTTDYGQHAQNSRWAREKIIDAEDAFARMRTSASSPFWHGRMLRVYLTSLVWNLKQRRFFTAASRLLHAVASVIVAGRSTFSGRYCRAISGPYQSITFQRGYEAVRSQKEGEAVN